MKRFLALLLISLFYINNSNCQVKLRVDWANYMDKHKLVWDIFPNRWENGPFIGNGIVGSIIYATNDSTKVKWTLGRSDVGRLDYPGRGYIPIRIQIGSINLQTVGKILVNESSAELDIWNAEASGKIKTTRGEIKWRSFSTLNEPVIIIELFDIKGDEKNCKWVKDFNCEGKVGFTNGINTYLVKDKQYHPRSNIASGGHAITWVEERSLKTRRLYIAISSSPATRSIWDDSCRSSLSSLQNALGSLENVRKKDFKHLVSEHRNWWHEFYQKSFVSLPRLDLESYYWIQLYKMASSSRKGYPMIDNHGVWSVEPVYGFATWDFNVQAIYRLHLKSNHLDLGIPFLSFMDRSFNKETMWNEEYGEFRAGIRQQTFLRYRFFDTKNWEHPENQPCDGPAKFLWGCHNYWLYYQYSMDTSLLKRLLPKLEGGINAIAANLEKEEDGKLHIPSGRNWENWTGKDPTGILAVFNWALSTAIYIGSKIDYDKDKIARWDSLQTNLVDYPTGKYQNGETGFLLGENQVPLSHRHWTHMLMIFPFHTLNWEQESNRDLIKNSINYWSNISAGLNNEEPKAGFAVCASICLNASIGQTDKISDLFDIFLYKKSSRGPNVWANTMYREFGPVIETPLFFAASLQELLLQSYNGIIKIFPAIPEEWEDAVFYNYRAEGGFLISAKYKNKMTEFIKIKSLAGEKCILQTNLEAIKCTSLNYSEKINKLDDNLYEIHLVKGDSILIFNEYANSDFIIKPIKDQLGTKNLYGLNSSFFKKRDFMKGLLLHGR